MNDKPNYYAVIPADVRYDKNLKPIERLFYAEVSALTNKFGYCSASNRYFAELYEVAPETVSRWVSKLVKRGYLRSEIGADNSRKLYLSVPTPIDENVKGVLNETSRPIDENVKTPIDENVKHNNTRFNNKFNNPPYPPKTAEAENGQICADALADGKPSAGGECVKSKKQTAVPVQAVLEAYNAELGGMLPQAQLLNNSRRRAISCRWRDMLDSTDPKGRTRYTDAESGVVWWRRFFRKVKSNPHWLGSNDRGWRADLDWLLKPVNFARVLEYSPKKGA